MSLFNRNSEESEEAISDPIIDPTNRPEKSKEMPQKISLRESPEFQELSRNWEESQKERETLKEKLAKQEQMFSSLSDHTKALEEKFSAVADIGSKIPAPDMKRELRDLRAAKKDALADENYDKVFELEDRIDEIKEERLTSKLTSMLPNLDEAFSELSQKEQQKAAKVASNQFVKETSWYRQDSKDYDPVMAAAAEGLDYSLINSIPDVKTRLAEVKKRVESRFNWKGAGTSAPFNLSVEGGNSTFRTPNKQTELTPEDEELIARMYPDNIKEGRERYRKQKAFIASTKH